MKTFRARWVLPVAAPPIENGMVAVSQGRIRDVGRYLPSAAEGTVEDLGESAILPGLVNAHCHLELSGLRGKLDPSKGFVDWIRQLIAVRSQQTREEALQDSETGIAALKREGTIAVGDISTTGDSRAALQKGGMRGVVFYEVLGLGEERGEPSLFALEAFLEESFDERVTPGISPHAPYSTGPALYRGAAKCAQSQGIPLATHLAETREEIGLLQNGGGPFRDFFRERGFLPAEWKPPVKTPARYLQEMGLFHYPGLAIHGNYLDPEEMSLLAEAGWSVVFCPGTHTYFGHEPYPLDVLLQSGVNIALGTDSLASNRSLSLFDEMREAARKHPGIAPEKWVRLATLNGAKALGMASEIGSLEAGKAAEMIAVPCDAGNPYEAVVECRGGSFYFES